MQSIYSILLQALILAGPKLAPVILEIFDKILNSLLEKSGSDTLEVFEPSEEELKLEAEFAQSLTADGSQAAFDGSRLRKLLALAKENGPALIALVKLLSGK